MRLPDGSTIKQNDTGTGSIYTDTKGQQHSLDALPKIDLETGALTLTVHDGQTSQLITVDANGTLTT